MAELTLHGRKIPTVFDLLGDKDNDLTFSLGWALASCDELTRRLLADIFSEGDVGSITAVRLQEFVPGGGFTDIELETERVAAVLEAKRGWNLPTELQLKKYLPQLRRADIRRLLVVSECSPEFAERRLPRQLSGTLVVYRSWKEMVYLTESCVPVVPFGERRLLRELVTYLRGLMTMQNVTSNMVYVVVLGSEITDWSDPFTPLEIVTKKNIYFHPVGNHYPKEPQNYLGFRWGGMLQQIRHVDSYVVATDLHEHIPEFPSRESDRHFIYRLGPPIIPPHPIKNGKIWPTARVEAALDLLLTCSTIAEARDQTRARLDAVGGSRRSGYGGSRPPRSAGA